MQTHSNSDKERSQRVARLGDALLFGTFGLLLFSPLAFGAVEP